MDLFDDLGGMLAALMLGRTGVLADGRTAGLVKRVIPSGARNRPG